MKYLVSEKELRQDLLEARLWPESNARAGRIYNATKSIVGEGKVHFVLTDTPEQTTDVFRVLVDDKVVVAFELDRNDVEAVPTEIVVYRVDEYRRALGDQLAERELNIAIQLAREEIASSISVEEQ